MGGRIVDLLSAPHLATEALLPWLLNDTLTSAERRKVEAHLQSCAQCRVELEQQKRLVSHYVNAATPDSALDVDAAFALLQVRLDPRGAGTPMRALAGVVTPTRWWHIGFALQMGVIAALGFALLLQFNATRPNTDAATYRGLSAPAQRAAGDALVIFDPNATEAQMRSALRNVGARIVDGPTDAGAFVVRFDEKPTPAAFAALRSEPAIVRIESLTAPLR